jgi:hypothetical protein
MSFAGCCLYMLVGSIDRHHAVVVVFKSSSSLFGFFWLSSLPALGRWHYIDRLPNKVALSASSVLVVVARPFAGLSQPFLVILL